MTEVVRFPLAARQLAVEEATRLGPNLVRVVLGGVELEGFRSLSPTDHVKLLVPGPGEDRPLLPRLVDDRLVFPDGPRTPMRDYSVRRHLVDRNQVWIDIVTHDHGHVSTWANTASPGDIVGVLGPRGSRLVPEVDELVLAGDLSAVPAIARWVEEIPETTRVRVWIAAYQPDDVFDIARGPNVEVNWVHSNHVAVPADLLPEQLQSVAFAGDSGFAWAAGEVEAIRRVRDVFVDRLEPDRFSVDGYWRRGRADYDHHQPLDAD